jgi:hypothetical protein
LLWEERRADVIRDFFEAADEVKHEILKAEKMENKEARRRNKPILESRESRLRKKLQAEVQQVLERVNADPKETPVRRKKVSFEVQKALSKECEIWQEREKSEGVKHEVARMKELVADIDPTTKKAVERHIERGTKCEIIQGMALNPPQEFTPEESEAVTEYRPSSFFQNAAKLKHCSDAGAQTNLRMNPQMLYRLAKGTPLRVA